MQYMMSISSWTLDERNVRTSFLYNYEPSYDCTNVLSATLKDIKIF